MGTATGDLRALRPIRILLVSGDAPFSERMSAAAGERGITLSCVEPDTDVDVELVRHGANVFVLDAEEAPRRGARSATAFAASHPAIPVVVVADRATSRDVGGLPLLDKRRSAERLLGEIELAYLGCSRSRRSTL